MYHGANIQSRGTQGNFWKELVSGADEKKDWKGITLAILCIILIGCLVALSVLILEPDETPLGPALTLKEIIAFSSYFKRNSVFSKSIWRKNSLFFLDSDGNIIRKDFQQPKTIVLAAFNSEFSTENVKDWDVSGDANFAILKKANDYDAFDNTDGGFKKSQMIFGLDTKKIALFGFENGANLALSTASKLKTLNCTLAISLLADSSDLASPISSNIKSSSNLTNDIDTNNIRKLKLISPLDDDFISPIDAISLDQKFGIQKDISLKFLKGTSESLLSSKYWDFYGEYFSSCLKKSSP
ncbi:Oidioi.mRNA.OKI2018_I69.PAR.g12460.t1.cds [Oikopleura dioica]|uniref:Oidioi.mRNA.OKI2018_I69.PAR.g12460.t1.cds n=1 Tax=Oikopleura dioica TaxID=34765 RepID=A0ABN7S3K1_OIKDI|nr:Oidioi.mRNA.OKI2018_I69.PAR.g12460.t1.cds [Oikopleura dioica]